MSRGWCLILKRENKMDADDELRYREKCEVLKQRRHSLQLRVATLKKNEEFLYEDIKAQKTENKRELSNKIEHQRSDYKKIISELHSKKDIFIQDIEELRNRGKGISDELKQLKKIKSNKTEDETSKDERNFLDKTVKFTREKYRELRNEVEGKENELQCRVENKNKEKERIEELEEIIGTKNDRILELKTSIENHKMDVEEIQMMMEKVQFDAIDANKKGNCLFSELEDHKKNIDRKIASLKRFCEKMNKQNEGFKYDLRKKFNEMKEWNFRLGNDMVVNRLELDVQKSLVVHKRLTEKMAHLKNDYQWIFRVNKFEDVKSPTERLDLLKRKLIEDKKKLDDENLRVLAARDEFKTICQMVKALEDDLAGEKRLHDKLRTGGDDSNKDSVDKALPVTKERVNHVQFNVSTPLEKENSIKPVVKRTKIKFQPVKIGKPVINSCEQQ